jgi:hypothetical protein
MNEAALNRPLTEDEDRAATLRARAEDQANYPEMFPSITWTPINDYPGDQQADLDGPFWAEIGTGDGPTTWSWTILANDDQGTGEVAGGTVASEAEAKAAVYEWKPRTAHITRDREADGTLTRPDGETVWNIGLYDPAVPSPDSGYVQSMGAATHRGAIAVADAWVNYKPSQVLTAATWVE